MEVNDELGVGHKEPVGAVESVGDSVGVGEEVKHREGEGVTGKCEAVADGV